MKRRVLILGGTGYLGSRLAAALAAGGLDVAVLKRQASTLVRLRGLERLVTFDLEAGGLDAALAWEGGVDAVVNAAGVYGRRGETFEEMLKVNTLLPLQVLERALGRGVPLFLNAGTALSPSLNSYALSKRQFCEWGRLLSADGPVRFVDVRIEHFYGPGDDDLKFATHAARAFVRGVAEYPLTEGAQERDFIYIDDVVGAFVTLLDRQEALAPGYVTLGVGSGQAVSVRRFVELLHATSRSTTRLVFGALPYRPHEVMHSCADIAELRALGWTPSVSLDEGVARLVAAERAGLEEEDRTGA